MKKPVLAIFFLALLLITGHLAFTYSGSAPPAGYTNAPGENNCTSCHSSFSLATSGTLWNGITLTTSVPLTSLQPSTTYTFNLTFTNPASSKYGFEMVALPSGANASSSSVGTFTSTGAETDLQVSGGRQYISHSAGGTTATGGSKTWTFDYTTPATLGAIQFYTVINSTNGNSSTDGDLILSKVFSSTVLPVKWLSYGVKCGDKVNTIEWATACETNNSHFEIERSEDAKTWKNIGAVNSKGNSNSTVNYFFNDRSVPSSATFYRIKQVDYDGNSDYTRILIANGTAEAEQVSYNAEQRTIHISNPSYAGAVSLFSLSGNPVISSHDGSYLNVSMVDRGIYLLQLPSGSYRKIFIY